MNNILVHVLNVIYLTMIGKLRKSIYSNGGT